MISWKFKGAYQLQIGQLNYRSFDKQGTAYIAMPEGLGSLDIRINNVWRKDGRRVRLRQIHLDSRIAFKPLPVKTLVSLAGFHPGKSESMGTLAVASFSCRMRVLPSLTIQNLDYKL
ncbi:hypothetical protein GS399_05075 [Pedobacter sp. HMF7647]|uniref:Uncharacterized protein n=1 Tax=Hufsiella arboris TaxID=2695275 RepID=A0A7K1Y6Y7_9SPHI|nr:hypothetical protein [Hufsiella arboris]MXV50336.1 hypothetical protein [Hufsiella arboris]